MRPTLPAVCRPAWSSVTTDRQPWGCVAPSSHAFSLMTVGRAPVTRARSRTDWPGVTDRPGTWAASRADGVAPRTRANGCSQTAPSPATRSCSRYAPSFVRRTTPKTDALPCTGSWSMDTGRTGRHPGPSRRDDVGGPGGARRGDADEAGVAIDPEVRAGTLQAVPIEASWSAPAVLDHPPEVIRDDTVAHGEARRGPCGCGRVPALGAGRGPGRRGRHRPSDGGCVDGPGAGVGSTSKWRR